MSASAKMTGYYLTVEEFEAVYSALEAANTPYESDDEVAELTALEATAWEVARQVRRRAGLLDGGPAF